MTDNSATFSKKDHKIKKKKRRPLLRSILLSLGSMLIVFLIWIFYPLPTPQIPLSSFLPAKCALKADIPQPAALWKAVSKQQYIASLIHLPGWDTACNIFDSTNPDLLTEMLSEFEGIINLYADDLFGIRNCLAIASGITFAPSGEKQFHAAAYLDNLGYLAVKAAFISHSPRKYKDLQYLSVRISKNRLLYIAAIPKSRIIIMTTDFKRLTDFKLPAADKSETVKTLTQNSIYLTLNLDNLPASQLPQHVSGGEISIIWQQKEIQTDGTIKIDSTLASLFHNPYYPDNYAITVPSSEKGLNINLKISPDRLKEYINTFLAEQHKSSNILLKELTDPAGLTAVSDLTGLAALNLTPENSSSTDLLKYPAIYYSVNDAEKTAETLFNNIGNNLQRLGKNSNLMIRLAASQIRIKKNSLILELYLPFFSPVYTIFQQKDKTAYGITTFRNKDIKLAEISVSPPPSSLLSATWKHSPVFTSDFTNQLPERVKSREISVKVNNYSLKIIDLIKILDSLSFLSLDLSDNIDNKNIDDRNEKEFENLNLKMKITLL